MCVSVLYRQFQSILLLLLAGSAASQILPPITIDVNLIWPLKENKSNVL